MFKDIKNNLLMLKYLWRARKRYIFYEIIKSITNSVMEVMSILLFKTLLDMLVAKASIANVIPIIIIYTLFKKIHELLFNYIIQFELPKTNYALNAALTQDIINKAVTIDLECFDNTEFYNNYTRALAETGDRSISALNMISTIIFNTISTIGMLSLIFILDPIVLILAGLLVLSSCLFTQKSKNEIYKRDNELTFYNRHMNYCKNVFFSRNAAKDLRTYKGIADYIKNEFSTNLNKAKDIFTAKSKKLYFYSVINTLLLSVTEYILPLIYFSILCINGAITVGSVTALWDSMKGLANNISGFSYTFAEIRQSSLYINNLKYILNYTPSIINPEKPYTIPTEIKSIIFHNVFFRYNDNEDYVLKNINIHISSLQKIAFVGHNGAGKSTLIKLILRLYDPSEGYITVNDIDIKNYDINEYRNMFITMFQDYSLFSTPISVNVLAKSIEDYKDEELIINSLKKAGLYNRINKEKKGIFSQYTKEFDESGVLLSGGESQKLALSRVFAHDNALIYILDEPSSALDVLSEQNFYKNLLNETNEKLVFLISHKLSTTMIADKIFFIENGEIIEEGSHDELMRKNGKYRYVFNLQADKYKYDSVASKIKELKYE